MFLFCTYTRFVARCKGAYVKLHVAIGDRAVGKFVGKMRAIFLTALIAYGPSAPASARSDTDYPHRDWGHVATLDMTIADATTCIARELNRNGDALVLPVEGGNDVDFTVHVPWGKKMEPWETFKLRSSGGVTTMRVFYRHPVRQNGVGKDVARLQKRCLKVKSIDPA